MTTDEAIAKAEQYLTEAAEHMETRRGNWSELAKIKADMGNGFAALALVLWAREDGPQ